MLRELWLLSTWASSGAPPLLPTFLCVGQEVVIWKSRKNDKEEEIHSVKGGGGNDVEEIELSQVHINPIFEGSPVSVVVLE